MLQEEREENAGCFARCRGDVNFAGIDLLSAIDGIDRENVWRGRASAILIYKVIGNLIRKFVSSLRMCDLRA